MSRSPERRRLRAAALTAGIAAALLFPASAWAAPQGRIQQVESTPGTVTFILSAEGLAEGQSIDPASVTVSIGGSEATTSAVPAASGGALAQQRTVMLVLDSSGSMAQSNKLATAKRAARAYLGALPSDVRVGLIAFADEAAIRVAPTTDRSVVGSALDALAASGSTALNDAVVLAVRQLGTDGSRNVVLLSDGEDEGSRANATQARSALTKSGVVLDAVALGAGGQEAQLAAFAKAGNGALVTATNADQLTEAFESAARTVDAQLAVTAKVPEGITSGTQALAVTARVGGSSITDETVAIIRPAAAIPAGPVAVKETTSLFDQRWLMWAAVAAVFIALATIASLAVGVLDTRNRKEGRVARRLENVSLMGAASPASGTKQPETVLGESSAVRRAVSFADQVASRRDTTALAAKLEEASVSLRPGEWIVVHGLIAVLSGLLATLIGGFNPFVSLVAVGLGVLLPWMYLGMRADRRRAKFYEALPDAMQMLSGSLSAGYSLPQALDNVAREAGGPLAQEVNRALLESRLGLPIEETLEAVAQRLRSRDFHWVVMAIRINRHVGGNLAEVLTNVGRTLRERERLRRQVKTLSAEGVLSAWILGLLPFLLMAYMLTVRPEYLLPLLSAPVGWLILGAGLTAYIIGIVWMRNLVRMEV